MNFRRIMATKQRLGMVKMTKTLGEKDEITKKKLNC